ncbi:AAA domain-containing protein [Metabacillus indicus]|uniref:AAA domain-containing protein n=1 Tax=Metabacillus indicus TaxID=246786 RepID=UPI002A009383|nr:AAA domain-containing protein [Metabacillus indicus]MDX8289129.1 AAA domain-containing protein [Metabacillus indicus]
MTNIEKKKILEILDYWKTIELLNQVDIPQESEDNKKVVKKITRGELIESSLDKISIFTSLKVPSIDFTEKLKNDKEKFSQFPGEGADLSFLFGRIKRNDMVDYLAKFVKDYDEQPDIAYPKRSEIAWFSFKTDSEGIYQKNSFQLSSLLWAISVWNKKVNGFSLNSIDYDDVTKKYDSWLQETEELLSVLPSVFSDIYNSYVKTIKPELPTDYIGHFIYDRYKNDEAKGKDENPEDYASLGKSFFLDDIVLLINEIKSGKFGEGSDYERKVINYILSAHNKISGIIPENCISISPMEDRQKMMIFFQNTLNIKNAPLGKWPAKFMPALMQQVAVNLAIDVKAHTEIFSVNGPPGTGKTTLLKEIVSSNIVKRAELLAEAAHSDPDDAYERCSFTQGPLDSKGYFQYAPAYFKLKNDKINQYGMLVASCNNSAVENITEDLPKSDDILKSLEPSKDDGISVASGLNEVHDLFDVEKSKDIEQIKISGEMKEVRDIYFTRYANKLLNRNDCWGLVSAPFGKRANINKYCISVLKNFINDYKSNNLREKHREKYVEQRKRFLGQLKIVKELEKELERLCDYAKSLPLTNENISEDDLDRKIKENYAYVMELEESRPRGLFGRLKKDSTRDNLISEKKIEIEVLKKQKEGLSKIAGYHNLLSRHSEGAEKLTPIDSSFMDGYASLDERASTRAQVTNPWFTEHYNREREKLFLYACKLHKEFVISSKSFRQNVINLLIAWDMHDDCDERMGEKDRIDAFPALIQNIFLITPVISTTFASAQTFLRDIKHPGTLGTLIVDEAGQAQPQMAVGALMRCRRAIIVGDPKQIEPVVTEETDMIKSLLTSDLLTPYKDKKISVQGFADNINRYGTFLGEDEEKEWVGCPLTVHRRCIDPMYSISNHLSYEDSMKQQTAPPKENAVKTFILDKSYWINVKGKEQTGNKNHYVPSQGQFVIKLLEEKFKKDSSDIPKLFIITPFKSVKNGMIDALLNSDFYKREPRVSKWIKDKNIGTVHTFQGQGTDEVIFLLGCDKSSVKAANWVNKNIVNVAATRSKYRLYIIGDKEVWSCKPVRVARDTINNEISSDNLMTMLSDLENTETVLTKAIQNAKVKKMEFTTQEKNREVRTLSGNISKVCPICGKSLVQRKGMYGDFYGCKGFPKCEYSESIKK